MKDRIRSGTAQVAGRMPLLRRVPGLAKRETGPHERTPLLTVRVTPTRVEGAAEAGLEPADVGGSSLPTKLLKPRGANDLESSRAAGHPAGAPGGARSSRVQPPRERHYPAPRPPPIAAAIFTCFARMP